MNGAMPDVVFLILSKDKNKISEIFVIVGMTEAYCF